MIIYGGELLKKKIVPYVILLFFIDQSIKLFIYFIFQYETKKLINEILSITPVFNRNFSYINSKIGVSGNRIGHSIFLLTALIIIILLYEYIKERQSIDKPSTITFIFGISGVLCSLVDTLFWNGSLDYIRIHGAFTFDLKDIYITIVEVFIAMLILFNFNAFKVFVESSWIEGLKDFIAFSSKRQFFKKKTKSNN